MNINTKIKKIIITLMLIVTTGSVVPSLIHANNSELIIERISNPDALIGEADGLEEGGNRETSYAWAMAARDNYVYIGTNKNIMGNVVQTFIKTMTDTYGIQEDMAWDVVNTITNGEVPRPTAKEGGYIFKCNINTGEIEKIFVSDKGVSFRMGIECNGDLFFASYGAENIGATDSTKDVKNYIYKIDKNDEISKVYESTGGASMRAACLHNGKLLFGGIDERTIIEPGDEDKGYTKLAIIMKDLEDDTLWTRIADYKDFIEYATDPALTNSAGSPIWDMCSYNGYVWAVVPGKNGFVMFKGHQAQSGETANQYGWIWEEVIGKTNGVNNLGLAYSENGYIGDMKGIISSAATPFVYKDNLYLFDFDMTITAEVNAIKGLLLKIAGQNPVMSDYLNTMYTILQHSQSLWCYNNQTGAFDKVEGFNNYMSNTCNEYVWRYGIYDNELYITTMDSAVMYKYIAILVGSDFIKMTDEELDAFIIDIQNYKEILETNNSVEGESEDFLYEVLVMLKEYKTEKNTSDTFNKFVIKYEDLFMELEEYVENINTSDENSIQVLKQGFLKMDIKGLKMYAYILKMLKNNIWGFDMLKTSDGINFEQVTINGLGEAYNYGGRSLVTTPEGLYLGTANPFYGAQLWRLRKVKQEDVNIEDSNNSENLEKPVDNTIAPGVLPNTGNSSLASIILIIFAIGLIIKINLKNNL